MGFVLQHLLTESAQRRPEAVAFRLQDATLTYGELERQSNQLAHALIAAGVAPGDRIALHLPKSLATMVGIFGVLKTGACYVPMDANAPGTRIVDIVEQTRASHLITSASGWGKIASAFATGSPFQSVGFVDQIPSAEPPAGPSYAFGEALPAQKCEATGRDGTDQDLAYILCTSGSTGKPKGVMLSHLNALTFVNWGCDTFQLSADDRLSNHAPYIFDLSIFDFFCGVKAGAAVSLIPEGTATIPSHLSRMIDQHRISVWYSVPSVLTLLLLHGALAERDLSALRLVLFAGEVFPIKYLRALMKALPHPGYFNLYGPTETNVCTYYEVEPIPEDQTRNIPIGKACANTEVFAIDENGQKIAQPGQEGLLYARGSTVMQGYFGRPAETAKAFIPNPFAAGREEKLYCTGDWVTLDEKGNFLFIGRKDHQIKTRGYRVELGDIEAVLYANPAVREAVAIALPDDLLGNTIKVVVVPADARELTEQDVKRHCAQALPRYMVPEEVEFRASLPRTATEKVDRPRLVAESLKQRGK
jgi:amino acid adenylation domain-containing protein